MTHCSQSPFELSVYLRGAAFQKLKLRLFGRHLVSDAPTVRFKDFVAFNLLIDNLHTEMALQRRVIPRINDEEEYGEEGSVSDGSGLEETSHDSAAASGSGDQESSAEGESDHDDEEAEDDMVIQFLQDLVQYTRINTLFSPIPAIKATSPTSTPPSTPSPSAP